MRRWYPARARRGRDPAADRCRKAWGRPAESKPGQAIVEFAIASIAFFMIVFGTIDFGRAIFMYSQLHNAVREGARYGKVNPSDTSGIQNRVLTYSQGLGLSSSGIAVSCISGCTPGEGAITVRASVGFRAITQDLLGIGPITLTSSATVDVE